MWRRRLSTYNVHGMWWSCDTDRWYFMQTAIDNPRFLPATELTERLSFTTYECSSNISLNFLRQYSCCAIALLHKCTRFLRFPRKGRRQYSICFHFLCNYTYSLIIQKWMDDVSKQHTYIVVSFSIVQHKSSWHERVTMKSPKSNHNCLVLLIGVPFIKATTLVNDPRLHVLLVFWYCLSNFSRTVIHQSRYLHKTIGSWSMLDTVCRRRKRYCLGCLNEWTEGRFQFALPDLDVAWHHFSGRTKA